MHACNGAQFSSIVKQSSHTITLKRTQGEKEPGGNAMPGQHMVKTNKLFGEVKLVDDRAPIRAVQSQEPQHSWTQRTDRNWGPGLAGCAIGSSWDAARRQSENG